MSSLSAAVFRRGGPKKELMELGAPTADGFSIEQADQEQLNAELTQLLEVLKAPKAGRDWSAALWRPEVGAAELVLMRRGTGLNMGFKWRRRHWLHMEEVAFLVDRSDLLLFVEEPSSLPAAEDTAAAAAAAQQQPTATRRLLSLQETFELMVLSGVSMERYIVYSNLSKSGYLVMRFPSCWMLPDRMTPGEVWGHGGWQGCSGLHLPAGPLARAAAASHLRSLHQGVAPAQRIALDGEEEAEAAGGLQNSGAGQQQQQHLDTPASAPDPTLDQTGSGAGVQVAKRMRLSSANGHGNTADRVAAPVLATHEAEHEQVDGSPLESKVEHGKGQAAAATRTWWPPMSQLRMLAAPASSAASDTNMLHDGDSFRNAFDPPVLELLRQSCPRLHPLPTISPDGPLPGGPPSTQAHLVFDVYKPGCHVARSKRIFPPVVCHLALCTSRPPRLQELHAADAEALSSTVPVKWVAVEGGICTWYEVSAADLLRLA